MFEWLKVDDKYQYSCEDKDIKVHGWICFKPPVGFWQITPSNEFRTGGPVKQELTSHVGPTTLAVSITVLLLLNILLIPHFCSITLTLIEKKRTLLLMEQCRKRAISELHLIVFSW